MSKMRAKFKVDSVLVHETQELLKMSAVGKSGSYDDSGSDENNTFSKFTPSGELSISVSNPDLFGVIRPGDFYYLDFTRAE